MFDIKLDLEGLLEYELPMAQRYRRFLSVAIIQPDDVPPDRLDRLEALVREAVRDSDAVCRDPSGALAVLLGETDKEGAIKSLRRCCARLEVKFHSAIASFPIDGQSVEQLLDAARRRLDQAGRQGSGAIVTEG